FCKRKCNYCDFVSYAGKEDLIEDYVEALCKEIEQVPPLPLGEGSGVRGFETIFFGGGTPTLLEPKHFENILSKVQCPMSNVEISMEANPGTSDKAKLKTLRNLGINRLSIGAQSFNNQHLKTLGRIHTAKDIYIVYDNARSAGFDNINLDLIFALPNQTLEEWKSDLETALHLTPLHLSIYSLQIEENTPFHKQGIAKDEELDLAMYEYAIETLTAAGFTHYEISNFAKPGFECKHNIVYWRNGNYLGIGAGAHSHLNGKRWANPDSIEEYLEQRTSNIDTGIVTVTDQRETIFMGLRLLDGLEIEKFKGFEKEITELTKDELLEKEAGKYKLTRRGLYLANEVFAQFV
ncbi:radical SAM family heme chaperone HemW, partial [Candidatus Margulisiibacteriota bacterium]